MDYKNPRLWRGFLVLNDFLLDNMPVPTDADIEDLRRYYPGLTENELLMQFAEQNECPDLADCLELSTAQVDSSISDSI
jgi:hypothetical protein